MLFCHNHSNQSTQTILTCLHRSCSLRFKLWCTRCHPLSQKHTEKCQFVFLKTKADLLQQMNYKEDIQLVWKQLKASYKSIGTTVSQLASSFSQQDQEKPQNNVLSSAKQDDIQLSEQNVEEKEYEAENPQLITQLQKNVEEEKDFLKMKEQNCTKTTEEININDIEECFVKIIPNTGKEVNFIVLPNLKDSLEEGEVCFNFQDNDKLYDSPLVSDLNIDEDMNSQIETLIESITNDNFQEKMSIFPEQKVIEVEELHFEANKNSQKKNEFQVVEENTILQKDEENSKSLQKLKEMIQIFYQFMKYVTVQKLMKFLNYLRSWYLHNHRLEISSVNRETGTLRLQFRNIRNMIEAFQLFYYHFQFQISSHSNQLIKHLPKQMTAVILHFQQQISGMESQFNPLFFEYIKEQKESFDAFKSLDSSPYYYLSKMNFDCSINLSVFKQSDSSFIAIRQLGKSDLHCTIAYIQLFNSTVIDLHISSCETFLAVLMKTGYVIIIQLPSHKNNQPNYLLAQEQSIEKKVPPIFDSSKLVKCLINGKYKQLQFLFHQNLLCLFSENRVQLFDYEKMQCVFEVLFNINERITSQNSILHFLSEYVTFSIDEQIYILDTASLQLSLIKKEQISHQQNKQILICSISPDLKYLLLVSEKEIVIYQSSKDPLFDYNQLVYKKQQQANDPNKSIPLNKFKSLDSIFYGEFSQDSSQLFLLSIHTLYLLDVDLLHLEPYCLFHDTSVCLNGFNQSLDSTKIYIKTNDKGFFKLQRRNKHEQQ